jgi:hypothetical protein
MALDVFLLVLECVLSAFLLSEIVKFRTVVERELKKKKLVYWPLAKS